MYWPNAFYSKRLIFIITNHKQFNLNEDISVYIETFKKMNLRVVEVYEYEINGSELSHISALQWGKLNIMRGWGQKNTVLKSKNNTNYDVNKIREEYIIWATDIIE